MIVPRRSSAMARIADFMVFRIVPAALLLGALYFGYRVVQDLTRRLDEERVVRERQAAYVQTATAIAPAQATEEPGDGAAAGKAQFRLLRLLPEAAQDFVTNTPVGAAAPEIILPPTNTAAPQATATPEPEVPQFTATPRPLPTLLMPANVDPKIIPPTAIPTQVPPVDRRGQDILNILLLGNDGEITNDGYIRTDTMIVLSINRSAGTVAMLSLPRDLYVYMPGWTMQRLNVAYIYGESAGWTDGGFGLLRETLFYNLGINVHYYAMVNLTGFKEIVDTLGGIDVAVDCALQDYPLVGAEVPEQAIVADEDGLLTLPVGYHHLNGGAALWYARSRGNSSDFDRGRRQQQVLRAIWRKARDTGQLANLPTLWSQASELIETNVPFEEILSLLPLALNLDTQRMEQFTMRRLYDTTPWQTPDGDYVQLPVYEHILELLNDMYTPPTESQIRREGAQIAVRNGANIENLDLVAAERLSWSGFNAIASGPVDDGTIYTDTILIDRTGQTKGSSLGEIAKILNVKPENIRTEPDPNRTVDFEVILGTNYNSCTFNVLPVEG